MLCIDGAFYLLIKFLSIFPSTSQIVLKNSWESHLSTQETFRVKLSNQDRIELGGRSQHFNNFHQWEKHNNKQPFPASFNLNFPAWKAKINGAREILTLWFMNKVYWVFPKDKYIIWLKLFWSVSKSFWIIIISTAIECFQAKNR